MGKSNYNTEPMYPTHHLFIQTKILFLQHAYLKTYFQSYFIAVMVTDDFFIPKQKDLSKHVSADRHCTRVSAEAEPVHHIFCFIFHVYAATCSPSLSHTLPHSSLTAIKLSLSQPSFIPNIHSQCCDIVSTEGIQYLHCTSDKLCSGCVFHFRTVAENYVFWTASCTDKRLCGIID